MLKDLGTPDRGLVRSAGSPLRSAGMPREIRRRRTVLVLIVLACFTLIVLDSGPGDRVRQRSELQPYGHDRRRYGGWRARRHDRTERERPGRPGGPDHPGDRDRAADRRPRVDCRWAAERLDGARLRLRAR